MHAPDDFGLSPAATVSHVADPAPAPWHTCFWQAWQQEFWRSSPRLARRDAGPVDASDPGVTHWFMSTRSTRVGCRLLEPVGPVRGGVVVTHGYGDVPPLLQDEGAWAPLTKLGLAVLQVRVRGYAGSQLDAGPLDRHPTGYITAGLGQLMHNPEDALAWVLPGAVADVANACRALHAELAARGAADAPISVRGESFGGGLAVIAAAQLAAHFDVARLAIGVPTLGDWAWRLALPEDRVPRAGMNREVRELLIREAHREQEIVGVLRLCDAAVHARAVRCPVLCKLAFRDDLVPAPTQAAVFNALGAPRGYKQRFVVRYGHFDGGLASARRHAEFETQCRRFLDPAVHPLDLG